MLVDALLALVIDGEIPTVTPMLLLGGLSAPEISTAVT
jgi:hypothetical protein